MTTETFDPTCDRCNYDRHICGGCGAHLSHGTEICVNCKFANQESILDAFIEGLEFGISRCATSYSWRNETDSDIQLKAYRRGAGFAERILELIDEARRGE